MKTRRAGWSVLAVVIGVGLVVVLPRALSGGRGAALADSLCVNPGGIGGCHGSIQDAVDAAADGDTIRVAEGTYYEAVVLTKSVTLEGGWKADFSARDWEAHPTTIDAQRAGSVIWVDGPFSPTIEGFVITGGDNTAYLGWGGGILVQGDWGGSGRTVIRHNVITDNVACQGSSCQGYGGGITVYSSHSVIEHNTVISNLARTEGSAGGKGGGIAIWGYPSNSSIAHNVVISNRALLSATGAFAAGQGGGVWSDGDAVLVDNHIRGNIAAVRGPGYGGGVYAGGVLYDNQIVSNTASVTGTGKGGGVYAHYVTGFENNVVQGNVASENGDGSGGGMNALYLQEARHNTFVGNEASRGGGLYYQEYGGRLILRDSIIARNRATGTGEKDGGGGISSAADWLSIVGNEIVSNTTGSAGGGVVIRQGTRTVLRDNRLTENVAEGGGGIAVYTATGTIAHNEIISNRASGGGGFFLWGTASPELDGNVVLNNVASGGAGLAGGGFLVAVDSGTTLTLTNHVVAGNRAGSGGRGGGLMCWQSDCVLINNTIVDNDRGDHGEGVVLAGGAHALRNTIIVGHSAGVVLDSGTADLDYNDYYDNDTNVIGATAGLHDRTDAPSFEDRAGGDYHLALTSPLVDQGDFGVNVPFDFEGDPRPRGGGYDIGADEAYPVEVYVSAHTGNDVTGDGSPGDPFATVTKGLEGVSSGGTVYVGRGAYTERITVTRSVELLGGYEEGVWARDVASHATTLDAEGTGTVVTVWGDGVVATVEGFTITGGEASSLGGSGGGVVVGNGAGATLRLNTITGNHASNGGGGVFVWGDEKARSVIDSNRIFANTADGVFALHPVGAAEVGAPQQGPEPGGGMLFGGPGRIVNNVIYGNYSGLGGDGMALLDWGGPVAVFHNTVADNGGEGGVGIEVRTLSAESALHNNLIVGHGTAISGTGQASRDANGFYDNDAAYGPGLSGGPDDVYGDPDFVNRGGGDYHLGPLSAMADRGEDVGVAIDIDGDIRPAPAGTMPDLGADEVSQRSVFLPLLLRGG